MTASEVNANGLFSALLGQVGRLKNLAKAALSRGADFALEGDYDAAAREFRRAISLDPSEYNAVKVYDLLATVYVQQDKTDDAVAAYKASIGISPANDETRIKLGNVYFSLGRYADAESEYKAAVGINPASSTNALSLGQAYLATGRYKDAETQFKQVISLSPNHHGGYYALGQTYGKEGRYEDAVKEFEKVVSLKRDFYEAYIDLGSAYADMGEMDKAREQLKVLNDNAPEPGLILKNYIYKIESPKLLAVFSTDGFDGSLGPGTDVSDMDESLSSADSSRQFNMVFVFSKEMDPHSVQNPFNWSIGRSPAGAPGGAYNWGLPIPASEARVSPVPLSVVYLPEELTATVSFMIGQNASANGTIDPSHITFKFSGKDAYGNAMDTSADEYNGVSIIV